MPSVPFSLTSSFRSLLASGPPGAALLIGFAASLGCSSEGTGDDGLGGAGSSSGGGSGLDDRRYVIEDEDEDCDDVEGLRASQILAAQGLEFAGDLSWTDLETGEEASRSAAEVAVTIEAGGTITCIPFRHLPGSQPEYARLSYDAVTLSIETDDGVLNEVGSAVAWLAETATAGDFELNVVRAFPAADAVGTFDVSPVLSDAYDTVVLVYAPSESMPIGHVSAASESPADIEQGGLVAAGVPHGYFPALAE